MRMAILVTGSAFLASVICKSEHRLWRYLLVFALSYMASCSMNCHAFELESFDAKLSHEHTKMYMEKCEYHKKQGEMYYKNAKDLGLFWGEESERQKANYCFKVLLATIAPSTPMSKALAAAIAFIADYGMDVMDRWHLIRSFLMEAEYHYKMLEFYEEVLIKA